MLALVSKIHSKKSSQLKMSYLLSCWIFLCNLPIPSSASEVVNKSEKVVKSFQQTKVKILKDELKKRRVLASLFDINTRMKKIVSEKASLDQQKLVLDEQIGSLASQIKEADDMIRIEQNQLRSKLILIYKLGDGGIARVVASSGSSTDIDRNLKIIGKIAHLDANAIKRFQIAKKSLIEKKSELDRKWTKLQKLIAKIKTREESFKSEVSAKQAILLGIRKSQYFSNLKIKNIRQKALSDDNDSDQSLLESILLPSFIEKEGSLLLPVDGSIKKKFGLLRNEEHGIVFPFKGIFIGTSRGTPVYSVAPGIIAFSGNVEGYGNTLILDHGDHYYSVYAHLNQVHVEKNMEISDRQFIGEAGEDTGSFGTGLYFELRHFSEPMDPTTWFNSKKFKIAQNQSLNAKDDQGSQQ